MLRRLRRWSEDQRGVTLIELMVVVAILAVIAAIAVPMVANSLEQSKVNTDKQNAAILTEALARWRIDNSNTTSLPDGDDLEGQYIDSIPARGVPITDCDTTGAAAAETEWEGWCVNKDTWRVR